MAFCTGLKPGVETLLTNTALRENAHYIIMDRIMGTWILQRYRLLLHCNRMTSKKQSTATGQLTSSCKLRTENEESLTEHLPLKPRPPNQPYPKYEDNTVSNLSHSQCCCICSSFAVFSWILRHIWAAFFKYFLVIALKTKQE